MAAETSIEHLSFWSATKLTEAKDLESLNPCFNGFFNPHPFAYECIFTSGFEGQFESPMRISCHNLKRMMNVLSGIYEFSAVSLSALESKDNAHKRASFLYQNMFLHGNVHNPYARNLAYS
jgi:hypothetical protein